MTTLIAPHPFGRDITQEQLITTFGKSQLWEERYRQLILLSRQLPALPEELKQQEFELTGCENRVWLHYQQLEDSTLHFYGDSESRIVKGLLAILFCQVEGLTPQQIIQLNLLELYDQLGLYQELSASRGNGLQSLINHIQEIAQSFV